MKENEASQQQRYETIDEKPDCSTQLSKEGENDELEGPLKRDVKGKHQRERNHSGDG